MNQNLVIECESIVCTSTVKRGQDNAHLKMTLESVRITNLMGSLIKEVGVAVILDHISDIQIENYLRGIK
tara:strand:+ start:1238 stop:1447 length:210 start_codon:yes stop_codon:yes gene_type:complete